MIDLESIELILDNKKPVTLVAKGTSMYPVIMSGDEVTIQPLDSTEKIMDKDILFVRCQGKYLIHSYDKAENKTRGMNCTSFDPPADKFIGKVTVIRKTFRSQWGRFKFYIRTSLI